MSWPLIFLNKSISSSKSTKYYFFENRPTPLGYLGVNHTLRGAKFSLFLSTVPILKITIDKHPISARDIEESSLRSDVVFFFCDKGDSKVSRIYSVSKQ
jgi:hypothetical protein